MIKFKINGTFQRREAEKVAERVPHVNVRATFVELPDYERVNFGCTLNDLIVFAKGDRGRLNALHSIRRHFEAATSDR